MGTNYYAIRKIKDSERKDIFKKLDEYLDDKIPYYEFKETLDEIKADVHLCKLSFGWKALFDHNDGKYYSLNRNSIDEFIRSDDYTIADEYGTAYTADEFWEKIDSHNNMAKNKMTFKDSEDHIILYDKINECEEKFKVDCKGNNDFTVGGLTFAVFTDFC